MRARRSGGGGLSAPRPFLPAAQVDAEDVEEVLIAAYMAKNLVTGRRAADEWLLDWANVRVHAGERGERRGVALQYEATKNNKEQRRRAKE